MVRVFLKLRSYNMEFVKSLIVCLCCVATILHSVGGSDSTAHIELLAKLEFPDYDSGVRPNVDGEAVLVEVDMVLISVGPINEMDMTWAASFYLRQEWTDGRLVLDPPYADKVVKMDGQKVSLLWLPDLFFSNNKEGRKHDLTVPNHIIYINSSTGRILYSQRLTVVLSCEMDLIKFPHDNQTCHMTMESYGFATTDLVLKWSSSRAATSLLPSANMPDFVIDGINTHDCTATYALGTYPCLKATMRMSREIGFYLFQTYLPSILIVILSWASFWIDHEAVPARISVGLLTVLTITTQLSGSRAQLPRVPYVKAIDVWMSLNLVFVFSAYMEYAVVTVLSRRYKKRQARRKRISAIVTPQSIQKLVSLQLDEESAVPSSTASNGNTTPSTITTTTTIDSTTTTIPAATGSGGPVPAPAAAESPAVNPALDSKDTGRKVDKMSRFLFPLAFSIFNIIYWSYYLTVA